MFKYFIVINLIFFSVAFSQKNDFNEIKKAEDGLYFMYFDSSEAKSTIVEFEDFVVMIEAPVKNEGGGARDLIDHQQQGEKILRTLADYFPSKPLKFLLHSHWHPHSISTVNPFLKNNVKVITTKANFEVIKKFVDTVNISDLQDKIVFVQDSLVIKDNKNSITAFRLLQGNYPNIPTEDYLFFYLNKYNIFHCACMYNKWEGEAVEGKEMLTGREEDLNKFFTAKNFKPEYLIRYVKEKSEANDMQPFSGLQQVIENGIRSADIVEQFTGMEEKYVRENMAEIVKDIIEKKIPSSIVNTVVYRLLRINELKKANSFAIIQSMLNPSDPNSWDTLGESYFFLGDMQLAEHYMDQSRKVSAEFNMGGIETWKKDYDEYSKLWENQTR